MDISKLRTYSVLLPYCARNPRKKKLRTKSKINTPCDQVPLLFEWQRKCSLYYYSLMPDFGDLLFFWQKLFKFLDNNRTLIRGHTCYFVFFSPDCCASTSYSFNHWNQSNLYPSWLRQGEIHEVEWSCPVQEFSILIFMNTRNYYYLQS